MQQNIDAFETFKCASIPAQRTPSTQLVLAAQPQERETPIPEAYMTVQHDHTHRARFDTALDGTTTRGQRAMMFLIVLLVFIGWALSLYLNWRLQ